RLVIAGMVDAKSASYLEELRSIAGADPRIEFRISPTDEELRRLYAQCYALLFTPFNEDLGIVPLEAMAFGKPVIAVNRGGPCEIIEHGVNGYLETPDPEAFASRVEQLASDTRLARSVGEAGRIRSRRFTWDAFTREIDSAIDGLVAGGDQRATSRASGHASSMSIAKEAR